MFGIPNYLKMPTKIEFSRILMLFMISLEICATTTGQDIIGCGGFVISEVEINFSIIEVKLYTKQGSLKYQTDCAPNTGYYMVPVYDKGDYILKVEPPPGWTFEPESVELHIDGQADQCSKAKDINFRFTGFGIVGKVLSKGRTTGPSGVTIVLQSTSNKQMVHRTSSINGGSFTFENVLPGDYVVTGEHSKWIFDKASETVTVGRDSGKSGTYLTVQGYNVEGKVFAEKQPIAGVMFLLYSEDGVESEELRGCQPYDLAGLTSNYPRQPICFTHSEENGIFEFGALPCGNYFIMPLYRGDGLLFDVVPKKMSFTVDHDSVVLKEPFKVAGFSIRGIIRYNSQVTHDNGVPNAQVLLNGQPKAKTNKNGFYTLEHLTTGEYSVDVTAPDLAFNTTTIKVTSLSPLLPDILVARFSVCGQVVIDKIPEGLNNLSKQRKVTYHVKGQTKVIAEVITEDDGRFCAQLPPGWYVVKVILRDSEKEAGLKLAPPEREVRIVDGPVKDVKFSQFRAQVTGKINCLESCGPLQLSLVAVGRSDDRQTVQSQTFIDGSRYTFHNVMPGKYKVSLLKDEWCWKRGSLDVEVTDRDVVESSEFSQSGYILSCSLSHDITLNFSQENKKENVGSFDLTKGVNKFCLSQPGLYRLTPVSCHRFEQDVYQYDTSSPRVLSLTAVSHRVEGAVVMQEQQDDVIITVRSSVGDQPTTLGPLKLDSPPTPTPAPTSEKKGKDKTPATPPPPPPKGPFIYKFQHWARGGEKLTLSASSKVFLFTPPTIVATVQGDSCPGEVAKFEGKKGIFIVGQIQPPLQDVHISIAAQNDPETKHDVTTDDKGAYRVGPLHGDLEYDIEASREGYVLTAVQGKHGHFKAFKLGEVQVKVSDDVGEMLGGVLLSLSGGQGYRSNNLTHLDGTMQFTSLSPGQYYLRPLMKEYRFDPASKTIEVTEGATLNVKIEGKRVAFSCYGVVTSLNGEAEAEVYVEAVGLGSDECKELQEESKTEQDGSFRIRGLQPHCDYAVRLRSGNVNTHIERAAPTSRQVQVVDKDLEGINIIAFRRMNQMDLSGNVVTASEYLPSLKVHLYKEDNQDSPLHSTSLTTTPFFYLPSLKIDNQEYVLRLESTLSKVSYHHAVEEMYFTANSTYKHFTFKFSPKRKMLLEQDLSQSSIIALPLTVLCLYFAYNYKKLGPVVLENITALRSYAANGPVLDISANKPAIPVDMPYAHKKQKLRKT